MVYLHAIQLSFVFFLVAGKLTAGELYFPPVQGEWETVNPAEVGWDRAKLQRVLEFAERQKSSGVVILHRGKILAERHGDLGDDGSAKFEQRQVGRTDAGHAIEDVASVQKSVTSVLVGIAQQKGLLKIDDRVVEYLGVGWSRATPEQERAITIRHLITMTSGLNDRGRYVAKPGTKWHYNSAAYAKTMEVVAAAAKIDRHELTRQWLTEPIGMQDSKWSSRGPAEAVVNGFGFATTARDLARFGLMVSAGGKWDGKAILSDQQYLNASTQSSQKMNPHYGYLWWVSRNSYRPQSMPQSMPRPTTAPADMFSAKGRLIRRCYVVPSLELVVTRLGDEPQNGKSFDNRFWKLLIEAAPK